jgi:serine protease inhibitor
MGYLPHRKEVLPMAANPSPAAGFNQLGIYILREAALAQPAVSLILSPLGLGSALAMLLNGAAGDSAAALRTALGLDGRPLDQINRAVAGLRRGLGPGDPQIIRTEADSLWVQQSFLIRPEFRQRLQQDFDAAVEAFDSADPDRVDRINRWVSAHTGGKISQLLDQLPAAMVLLLLDALYFNGRWQRPFDPAQTHDRPFHPASGNAHPLPMMTQSGRFAYLAEPDFQAVRLPYGQGALALEVFLPARGQSLVGWLGSLDATRFGQWSRALTMQQGEVILPRFSLRHTWDLNQPLKQLGLADLFLPGRADFAGLSPVPGLAVGAVKQQALIEVDEAGTVAAAVTSILD